MLNVTATKDSSQVLCPIERVFSIGELCAHIISFLFPRQIRQLRLVSKQFNVACSPHVRKTLLLNSGTPTSIFSDPTFPRNLITSLRLDALDQVSSLFINLVQRCPNISSLDINDFGLDVNFIEQTMAQLVSPLRRLAIRSDGFVTVESMVEAVLNSNAAGEIRILILEIVETGLFEKHALSWSTFKSILYECSSLSALSLGSVKIPDIPNHTGEINTFSFPNILSLSLKQCDISSSGLITLLRIFPNLTSLEVICRDAVFDIDYTNDDSAIDFNFSGDNSGVDSTQLFVNLRRVSVNCTNSRSNVDQRSLYRLLAILPNVDTIELVGVGASGQRLQETAEEWTRRGMQLKRLQLDFNRKKSAEEDLEVILKQGCCSKLELLDVWCGPEFLARFWNQELQKSELPFLLTLRSIHLRKNTDTFDEKADGICCFNLTLRQMPKLVDLVIRAKLNDCNFLHGMGCDPDLRRAPIDTIDWSHEKPFLQTLAIGFSLEFCNSYSFRDLRQQIKKRFRFLESFRLLTE